MKSKIIIKYRDYIMNKIDPYGNSALMLSVKLKRIDAIKVLCDNNAEIKHYYYNDAITPFDVALVLKEKEILKIIINASKKQKLNNWENNQKFLINAIKDIPDFSMSFEINLNSNYFSLIKNITPKDKFKVNKIYIFIKKL
jgi:hypothetical protein